MNENPEDGLVIGTAAAAAADVAIAFSPKEILFEATTGAGTKTEAAVDEEEEDILSVAAAVAVFSTTLVEPNENGASEFGIEMENFDVGNDVVSAAAAFSLSPTGCEALPKGAEGRRLETAAEVVAISLIADDDEFS